MLKLILVAVMGTVCTLLAATTALGQGARPFDPAPRQSFVDQDGPYSVAPVSPYVNLGVNANGLSNYAALVRPLVQQREAQRRQSQATRQPASRVRGAPIAQGGPLEARATRGRPPVRFMNYSHYFGERR
jgi:hypothetical protein